MTPTIEARGLVGGWGRQALLRGLDLRASPGERIAVLGPNGAGKTTFFDVLAGRLRPRAGQVLLGGADVTRLPLHLRARQGLGYVPQTPSVFPTLSVRRNLEAALSSPARRAGPGDEREELERLVRRFGLSEVLDRAAGALSGGERRRVEVARALACRPTALLLDEPFAGLDPAGRLALRRGLEDMPPRMTLLVTDHAADDLLSLCERVVLIVDGALVFDGPRVDFTPQHPSWARYFGA